METSISFSTDSDGFLSQECPACSGRFKVIFGEGSSEPISFCPYCAHMGKECWWTSEQARYIEEAAAQAATKMVEKEFAKMSRKFNSRSRSGLVKMEMKTKRSRNRYPIPPNEMNLELPIIEFSCCKEQIKYFEDSVEGRLFCVICGNEKSI